MMRGLLESDIIEALSIPTPPISEDDHLDFDDDDRDPVLSSVVMWLQDLPTDYEKTDLPIYDQDLICPDTREAEDNSSQEKETIIRSDDAVEGPTDKKPLQSQASHPQLVTPPTGASVEDVPPDDVRAFFGHPLTAAATAIEGPDDTHISGLALLHEYQNLPAMDRSGMKIGDKFQTLQDLFSRAEEKGDVANSASEDAEYINLLNNTDIDNILLQDQNGDCNDSQGTKGSAVDYSLTQGGDTTSEGVDLSVQGAMHANTRTNPDDVRLMNGVHRQICFEGQQLNDKPIPMTVVRNKENGYDSKRLSIAVSQHDAGICMDQTGASNSKPSESTAKMIKILKEKLLHKRNNNHLVTNANVPVDTLSGIVQESLDITHQIKQEQQQQQQQFQSQDLNDNIRQYDNSGYATVSMPVTSQHQQVSAIKVADDSQRLTVNITQAQYFPQAPEAHSAPVMYSGHEMGYYYNAFPYPSNTTCTTLQRLESDPAMTAESYVRHQQQQQQTYQDYYCVLQENENLKSPDSGFQEPCISPTDASKMGFKESNMMFGTEGTTMPVARERVTKRRRSQPNMCVKQLCQGNEKHAGSSIVIPKLENDTTGYRYFMETPISTTQKVDEDKITYLNKGQYYGLTLEYHAPDRIPKSATVRSVIMVVFRDDKTIDDEMKAWEFWHSRQHSIKQRIIDIDTKNSSGIAPNTIEEIAHNAVSIRWNPREGSAKVNIAINCLSTDFSNQKGVKGLPLHIQIDTFESIRDTTPQHRGYNQIKIFCDKGAERKTRDEERRRAARAKNEGHGRKKQEDVYHSPNDRSEFYIMADRETIPVIFNPFVDNADYSNRKPSPINGLGQTCSEDDQDDSSLMSGGENQDRPDEGFYPSTKRQRRDSYNSCREVPKILLYVREQHETVFTALLVQTPTLQGLLEAVEEKYSTPPAKVKNTYKRSKKGILVKMDDNIVRHFTHESTFIIEVNKVGVSEEHFEIILIEIDPV